jgi:hypothetical protein
MVRENPYITIKIRINEEQKYYTVRTVPKSNRKSKNTTLSEQF